MSTSPLELLLPQLEGVRRTGHGRYVARCPSHGDRHPSLAIRETDDGVLLLHCFAGCSTYEVVSAIGIALGDLFPQQQSTGRNSERRPFSANDLLILAAWESLLASVIANDIAQGIFSDKERLLIAAGRLQHIAEVANVR